MSGGSEAPAILAERVSKHYGSFAAVDRLDLSVRRGEVFCLFGPNGSGKTTFLRMLTGYISPSAGPSTMTRNRSPLACTMCWLAVTSGP